MPNFSIAAANAVLQECFAPWVLALGIKAELVGADTATLRIPFSDQLCRVGGIMCGQALLTGADTAMVIALAAASGGFKPCTTVDLTTNYMRPVTKADALLDAKVMRLGKTLAFCTCEVREAGAAKPSAFATGTYAILG
ncbi:MAG: PaaI family thioesterase [Hyphomicrobiaceae bacterium]|nr:MAG: PaaI family thioesterase [Hyphomicrobiaceae bacterium]